MADKKADLAGPGIGDYDELAKELPGDYSSLLTPRETQEAILAIKTYIEENLCKELNLMMVTVPLIVDVESGVNDYLDRDGSRVDRHPRLGALRQRPAGGEAWNIPAVAQRHALVFGADVVLEIQQEPSHASIRPQPVGARLERNRPPVGVEKLHPPGIV